MDYNPLFADSPYSWPQQKKDALYLTYMTWLTAFHQNRCQPYRRATTLLPKKPTPAETLFAIPMIPIRMFKSLPLKSIDDEKIFKTVVSSGTSGQVSQIYLDETNARNQQLALYAIVGDLLGPNRLPMLIIDTPAILSNRDRFTARGAAVLGFSIFAKKKCFALTESLQMNTDAIQTFLCHYGQEPFLIFGFTFMIWQYLYKAASHVSFDLSNAVVVHGGGWKKMQDLAVSPQVFKESLRSRYGIERVHNYYGMAEQTGSIYVECSQGHLHASNFSDVIMRDPVDFSPLPVGKQGIIQVLSPLATAYPGHSILTEDMGTLLGYDDCPCGRKGKYFSVDGRIPSAEIRGCSDAH